LELSAYYKNKTKRDIFILCMNTHKDIMFFNGHHSRKKNDPASKILLYVW